MHVRDLAGLSVDCGLRRKRLGTVVAGAGCAWTATQRPAMDHDYVRRERKRKRHRQLHRRLDKRAWTFRHADDCRAHVHDQSGTGLHVLAVVESPPSATAAGGSGTLRRSTRPAAAAGPLTATLAGCRSAAAQPEAATGRFSTRLAANTGPERSGTITAAGQTFTVTQSAGCSYSISPTTRTSRAAEGRVTVAVTAPAGLFMERDQQRAMDRRFHPAASGSGNGTVQLVDCG